MPCGVAGHYVALQNTVDLHMCIDIKLRLTYSTYQKMKSRLH